MIIFETNSHSVRNFQNPESRIHFANDGDDDGEKIHSMKMFVNRIECRSKQENNLINFLLPVVVVVVVIIINAVWIIRYSVNSDSVILFLFWFQKKVAHTQTDRQTEKFQIIIIHFLSKLETENLCQKEKKRFKMFATDDDALTQ